MKKIFLIASASVISFVSCHKSERDEDTDPTAINDLSQMITLDNDVFKQLHFVCDSLSAVNKIAAGCVTYSVSGASYPKTVTIDFGAANCVGPDGRSRRGQIIAIFYGKYRDSLTTISLSSNNYFVQDKQVDISKTIVNNGTNANGNLVFTIYSNDTITLTNNKTISYSTSFKREWTGGETTVGNFSDDIYSITGSASGSDSRGSAFSYTITSPLTSAANCTWISSGNATLVPGSLNPRYIYYGNGTCDSEIEYYLNNHAYNVGLP